MSTLGKRLKALETAREQPMKDVKKMTDAELLAVLSPVFGGRVPTDAELLEFVTRGTHAPLRDFNAPNFGVVTSPAVTTLVTMEKDG